MTQSKSGLGEFGWGLLLNTRDFGVGLLLMEAWIFSVVAFACLPRNQSNLDIPRTLRATGPALRRTTIIDCWTEGLRRFLPRVRVCLGRRPYPSSCVDQLAASRDVERNISHWSHFDWSHFVSES